MFLQGGQFTSCTAESETCCMLIKSCKKRETRVTIGQPENEEAETHSVPYSKTKQRNDSVTETKTH